MNQTLLFKLNRTRDHVSERSHSIALCYTRTLIILSLVVENGDLNRAGMATKNCAELELITLPNCTNHVCTALILSCERVLLSLKWLDKINMY